ncbi:MAG: hypothetical protein JW919_04055 [Candidatus Omnitrophica bacterium]|nr:hypothetical protein [Candidatus Omnitrophota bacterium]
MTRKSRIWIGITLLAVITFNYALIGIPMMRRSAAVEKRAKEIIEKRMKSRSFFRLSDDEYMIELFRREKAAIDRNLFILNLGAASLVIIVGSWTVFGLIFHKYK